jgi:multidrug resistance efflux pump
LNNQKFKTGADDSQARLDAANAELEARKLVLEAEQAKESTSKENLEKAEGDWTKQKGLEDQAIIDNKVLINVNTYCNHVVVIL